jgi:hypothetical protein
MTHAILSIRFLTDITVIRAVLVPDWVERVILRRKRRTVNYMGRGRKWKRGLGATDMKKCGWILSFRLWSIERALRRVAKKRNTQFLRFV